MKYTSTDQLQYPLKLKDNLILKAINLELPVPNISLQMLLISRFAEKFLIHTKIPANLTLSFY